MRLSLNSKTLDSLSFDKQTRVMDTQLRGFGVLVSQTTKTFIVIKGKERRLTTLGRYPSVSLKNARRDAQRILADQSTTSPSTLYPDAVQGFLKAKAGHIKPRTIERYRYYLERLAFTGNVHDITRQKIKEKLALFDGTPRAQNASFSILRTFLNWCVEEGVLDTHPAYRAKAPNPLQSRKRVLTDDELKAIWNATDFKPYGYIIRLLILTGARRSEIRTLTTTGEYITFKDTKNKTDHSLPITPLVRAHLMEPYAFNNWQREKERLDTRSGVKGWTVHDIRRSWATNAARLGIRPETIERVLNHKQTGIQEVYQRWHYHPEIHHALLTHEHFITTLVAPGQSTRATGGSPQESSSENAQQTGTTP